MAKTGSGIPPNDLLRTSNIYLASYAVAHGCRIIHVDKTDRKKAIMHLEGKNAHFLEQEFYDDDFARKLFDSYRNVKDRVFENHKDY